MNLLFGKLIVPPQKDEMNNLDGKTIAVTGATSGIGLAVAKQLSQQGATVIGIGRSPERCAAAEFQLKSLSPTGRIRFLSADLSLQSEVLSVAHLISTVVREFGSSCLDCLINNAGTFFFWLTLTSEGFEMQWAVNHLAPFLLTHKLLPILSRSPASRVVTVSSHSHYNTKLRWDDIQLLHRYNGLRAYKQTKLANVLFSFEFNRRLNSHTHAFAADPGLVNTDIGTKADWVVARWFWYFHRKSGISPDEAAKGIVYLVCEPSIQNSSHVYWKHGTPKIPSTYAIDPNSSSRLWDLSEEMCGITHANINTN